MLLQGLGLGLGVQRTRKKDMATVLLLRTRAPPSCQTHSSLIGCRLSLRVPGWKLQRPPWCLPRQTREGETALAEPSESPVLDGHGGRVGAAKCPPPQEMGRGCYCCWLCPGLWGPTPCLKSLGGGVSANTEGCDSEEELGLKC